MESSQQQDDESIIIQQELPQAELDDLIDDSQTTHSSPRELPELLPNVHHVDVISPQKIVPANAWFIFIFSIFQFGVCTGQAFSQAIYLPLQVVEFTGEAKKAKALAIVGVIIAFSGMMAGPISGYISDRLYTRLGRRTPLIIVGSLVYAIHYAVRPFLPCNITFFFIVNTVVTLIGNIALIVTITAYLAMIPEYFPTSQMGLVSGLNGFTNLISIGIAVALFGYLYPIIGAIPICLTISIMILVNLVLQVLFVRDPVLQTESYAAKLAGRVKLPARKSVTSMISDIGSSFVEPYRNLDFVWTFLTRFLFTLGTAMIQTFGLYFLKDKVGPKYPILWYENAVKTPEQALAAFMIVILITGMCSSIIGGILSDRIGRKPIIMISGLLVSIGCVAMCFVTNFNLILIVSVFVGLGSGSYYGTDLSLANDIIGTKEAAKSIAIFQLAQNFPVVLANPVGGMLIVIGNSLSESNVVSIPFFGYVIMAAAAAVLTISSSLLVMLVRSSNVMNAQQQEEARRFLNTPNSEDEHTESN